MGGRGQIDAHVGAERFPVSGKPTGILPGDALTTLSDTRQKADRASKANYGRSPIHICL